MTNNKPDWIIFMENLDRPIMTLDERAEEIADILESGKASPEFLVQLSRVIRPSGKKQDLNFKLEYVRKHEPKRISWRIEMDMIRLVDDELMSIEEAVYQVQTKWGLEGTSRSKCLACLKRARMVREVSEMLDRYASPDK